MILFISDALESSQKFSKTNVYNVTTEMKDFRHFSDAKKDHYVQIDPYIQVFDEKHGFIPNLSILDLLFMEGGNTSSILENLIKN